MKAGKVFWRESAVLAGTGEATNADVEMTLAVDRRIWIHPHDATDETNFTLFALPGVSNTPVPVVDSIFRGENRRTFRPVLYAFSSPDYEFKMEAAADGVTLAGCHKNAERDYFPHVVCDPAPRWIALLLELSGAHYAPLVDEDSRRAIKKLIAFQNYGDVLDGISPKTFERQSFVIAALWPSWEGRNLSWDARAAELLAAGVTFNCADAPKNTDALEKRCRRLELKRGDAF